MSLTSFHATEYSHLKYPMQAQPSLRNDVDDTSVSDFYIMERLENEIWKDVVGYEGRYRISSIGRILSLDRPVETVRGNFSYTNRINGRLLKTRLLQTGGYESVTLSKNHIPKQYLVHRLIALAFIPNPENKKTVNHKNGIKTANYLENLEWSTQSENVCHAHATGLTNPLKGERQPSAKLTDSDVIKIRSEGKYSTNREIGLKWGVCKVTIAYILNNKTWKHLL